MDSIPSLTIDDPNLVNSLVKHYDELDAYLHNNDFLKLQSKLDYLINFFIYNGKQMDKHPSLTNQLDIFFVIFRDLLRNNFLPSSQCIQYSIKLLLLRLIENRAARWKIVQNIEEYYQEKIPAIDIFSSSPTKYKTSKKRHVLRTSKSAGDVSNLNHNNNHNYHSNRPLKTLKKQQFEDDILIKNSDSGRVMGVKGRRVHMIERLSNTVISFQKVPPTSLNRFVHIIGSSYECIELAKSIIHTTIRDNISPIADDLSASRDSLGPLSERTSESIWSNDSSSHVTPAPEYRIRFFIPNEEIIISMNVPQFGKHLEEFLTKYDFINYLKNYIENSKKNHIVYDRETLLHLQNFSKPLTELNIDKEFIREDLGEKSVLYFF